MPIVVQPARTLMLELKRGEEAAREVTLESREASPLEIDFQRGFDDIASSVFQTPPPAAAT